MTHVPGSKGMQALRVAVLAADPLPACDHLLTCAALRVDERALCAPFVASHVPFAICAQRAW